MDRGAEVALAKTAVSAVLWGTSFPVIAVGIRSGLDPVTFVFLRFAAASPLMLAYLWATGRSVRSMLANRSVWVLGLLNTTGFLAQFLGQQYTDASVAALLVNLSVVLAAAGGAVFLGEALGVFRGLGVALAFGGTLLVATKGAPLAIAGGQEAGDLLYLLAAVTWAGYMVYARKETVEKRLDPASLAAGVVVVTAVVVSPLALVFGSVGTAGSTGLWAIVYTAVLNTAIPFVLYQQGLGRLSVASSAVVLVLEIVVALAISAAFLGEELTPVSLFGAAAILASVFLVSGTELGRGVKTGTGSESLSMHHSVGYSVSDAAPGCGVLADLVSPVPKS